MKFSRVSRQTFTTGMNKKRYALAVAIATVIVIFALLLTLIFTSRGTLTARDYYYQLLPNKGFASYIPSDAELQRIAKSLGLRESLDERRKILSEQGTPDKELVPLLEDIRRNTPEKYKATTDDIYAGVFPLGKINARAIPSPGGGYLILVNYKLKKALWEWAKLTVSAAFVDMGLRKPSPGNSLDAIKAAFIRSMSDYVSAGTVPAFPEYLQNDQQPLVELLHIAALEFCLAHEYAHILLGHMREQAGKTGDLRDYPEESAELFSVQEEIDADLMATEILMNKPSSEDSLTKTDLEIKGLGIVFALSIFTEIESMNRGHGEKTDSSSILYRLTLIKSFLYKKYFAVGSHPVASSLLVAIDYLFIGAFTATKENGTNRPELAASPQEGQARPVVILKPAAPSALKGESGKKAADRSDFLAFMREFYEHKQKEDWSAMSVLVKRTMDYNEYVDILLDHALVASEKGIKNIDLPWDPSQTADASGYVELALAIIAASQERTELRGVSLSANRRSRILLVWRSLYGNALAAVGVLDDPRPDQIAIQEAIDKSMASLKIGDYLDDLILKAFGVFAGAFIMEREGDKDRSAKTRRNLGLDLGYPPISRGSDGRLRILYPKFDASGNEVPGTNGEEAHANKP